MPRRHQRGEQVPPLTITPADLAKPKPPRQKRTGPPPEAGDSRRDLTKPHRTRLEREDARAALRECAMPLCTTQPIYDNDRGFLGICFHCALDVAHYFDKLDDVPQLTERRLQRQLKEMHNAERIVQEMESRAISQGWVYYIQVDQRIKIGYSIDVRERMRAYPPHAVLLAVHPGTPTLEREMHAKFTGLLAAGREWFNIGPELLEHIETVVEQFGKPDGRHIYKFREGTKQTTKPRRKGARNIGRNFR